MRERSPYPTQREVVEAMLEQFAIDLSKAFAGVVQGLSADRQTCDIVPLIQQPIPRPDGGFDLENPPVIPSCAILRQRSRGAFLTFPIEDGDTVLCVALDDDHSAWRRGSANAPAAPRDLRRHHPAHAVVVGGFYRFDEGLREASVKAARAPVDGVNKDGIVLGYDAADGTRLLMKPDGVLDVVHGTAAVLRVEAGAPAGPPQAVALAAATDAIVSSLKSLIAGWTPTGTGDGAALKALIATWSPGTTAAAKVKAT